MSATAPDLLAELTRSGVRLEPRGDRLHVSPPPGMDTAELRQRLAEHKAEILAELRARDTALLERCKEACKGLTIWPAELLAALDESDKAAQLSGEEGPETLRCFAQSLAERLRTGRLPENLHAAYERLRADLAAHPGRRFASEVLTPDDDPILLACAVRGAGFATLRIAREKYDEGQLLTMVHRFNTKE